MGSSFGNELEPTCNWLELIFSCCITLAGLVLFVTLIGNIQVIENNNFFILFDWNGTWLNFNIDFVLEIPFFLKKKKRCSCILWWQTREKCSWNTETWNGGWRGDNCQTLWKAESAIFNAIVGQPWEDKMRWNWSNICPMDFEGTLNVFFA